MKKDYNNYLEQYIYLPSVMPKVRLSRLWIENFELDLLAPVFKFLTPGRKV